MKKLLIILVVISFVWQLSTIERTAVLGPGVKAPDPPLQTTLSSLEELKSGEYTITPLVKFHIRAKVLAKKRYYFDREADLSRIDLALGWEKMSDEDVLDRIKISQSDRWYLWSVKEFPISREEIETQSANMHMIPANDTVEDSIDSAKQGQIIELEGYLVRVEGNDNWYWQSSLSREDTGSGACELIFVTQFKIIE